MGPRYDHHQRESFADPLKPAAIIYVFCPNDLLCPIRENPDGGYDLAYAPSPGDRQRFAAFIARQQPDYWSFNKYYRQSYGKAYHARIIRPMFSRRIYQSLMVDPAPEGFDFPPPLNPPVRCTLDDKYRRFLFHCLDRIRLKAGDGPMFIIDTSDKSIVYRYDKPDNRRWLLHAYAAKRPQVHYIDFETHMRKTPNGKSFYLDYDDHWSAAGHAEAARLLLREMMDDFPGSPKSALSGDRLQVVPGTSRAKPIFMTQTATRTF